MKVALGIIARPVESLLILCLKPIVEHFDGIVMLTSPGPLWKKEVASLVHGDRAIIVFDDYVWKNDYGHARNILISYAERLGYDCMVMLDADESMLPEDLVVTRQYMEDHECLFFPRYEFVDDFHHFCPSFYPDWQGRAFKLRIGYHYANKLHEQLRKNQDNFSRLMPYSTFLPMCHIFHYGKSKPTWETWLKYSTYERIAAGQVPFTSIPEGVVIPSSWALENKKVAFLGAKPL